jgi:hypothetical protein
MKRTWSFIFILFSFLLLTSFSFPQQAAKPYIMNFGTMAVYTPETGYFQFGKYAEQLGLTKIDSIEVAMYAENEVDVDSVNIYLGVNATNDGVNESAYDAVLGTYTVTININDASTDYERLFVSNATIITGAAIRGYNSIKAVVCPSTGNDATDPNKVWLLFYLYGTK